MLRRFKDLVRFIKGDFIVLKIDEDKLVVDAERFDREVLRTVASTFFQRVYNL